MLDIVASYNSMQFHRKLMIQLQENGEKPHFGPDLDLLGSNSGHQTFLKNLALLVTRYHVAYHHVQYNIRKN